MLFILRRLFFLCTLAQCALAADISFTGTFTYDTDVQFFTFTVASPTTGVAFRTWSYSGGINSAGTPIPAGGFEPVLSLFESDGSGMNPGQAGPCTGNTGNPLTTLAPDPITGGCGDVYYPTTQSFPGGTWMPGTYTLAISMYSNPAAGNLSDGFLIPVQGYPVPGNYTCMVGAPGVQGSPATVPETDPFCDEFLPGAERTGSWALDIINVDSATQVGATPEPGTISLMLLAGIVLQAVARRKAKLADIC